MLFWLMTGSHVVSALDERLSDDQRMVTGLRDRLLFDLADRYCDLVSNSKDVEPVNRSDMAIERIRTQMARAILAKSADRSAAWEQCQQLGAAFLDQNANHPRSLLIKVQQGLALLAEARLISQELSVKAASEADRETALARLRAARSQFDSINNEIGAALTTASQKRTTDQRLVSGQLLALRGNVSFQLAMCHFLRASLSAESDSTNRIDALSSALRELEEVSRTTNSENPLWWSIQLHRAAALRLTGHANDSARVLAELPADKIPADHLSEVWEQRLELAIVESRPDTAVNLLKESAAVTNQTAQLQLAALRLMLHMADLAADQQRSAWLAQAARLTSEIESTHGQFWGRLAELTLVGGAAGTTMSQPTASNTGGSTDILIRTGDNAVRDDRVDDALRAYRAAADALRTGEHKSDSQWQSLMLLQLKISRLLEDHKQYSESEAQLLAVVALQPQHELAATLHLRAIWCAAQLVAVDSTQKTKYRELLIDHLAQYSRSETADQARLWLGRIDRTENRHRSALDQFLAISPTSQHALDGAREVLPAARAYLTTLDSDSGRIASEANSVSKAIWRALATSTSGSNEIRTPTSRELLSAASFLAIHYGSHADADIAAQLQSALSAEDGTDLAWRRTATGQLIAVLAVDSGQRDRAVTLIDELTDIDSLERCLELLDVIATRKLGSQANEFRLTVLEKLLVNARSKNINSSQWRLQQAQIWSESGRLIDAATALEALAKELPKRLDVQTQFARALGAIPERQTAALTQWRRIAAGVKDHSAVWYESKFNVARLLLAIDQKTDARQLLEYIQSIPPGWSQSELKSEFEALLLRCK